MSEPNPSITPKPYTPKHQESYFATRLVLGAALRRDDHTHTTTAARTLAESIAQALDLGKLEVDGLGIPIAESEAQAVLITLETEGKNIGTVVVVDAQGRPVMIPAPKNIAHEVPNGQIPLRLYTGAAYLAAQLAVSPLSEREILSIAIAASLILVTRQRASDDAVRTIVARAIEDVRLLSAEAERLAKAQKTSA